MDLKNLQLALQLFASGMKVKNSPAFASLKENVSQLLALLKAGLPRKPDGSDWTDEELEQLADNAEEGFLETLLREQPNVGNSGPDGHSGN